MTPPAPAATAPPPSPAEVYRHGVRVYWEDTDAGGIVFYANYLKFFERARTEWLRHLGFGQHDLRQRIGGIFVVTETTVRYLRPAKLDDWLTVTVAPHRQGRASFEVTQQAWCGDTLLAEGDIRVGFVDDTTLRPRRLPDDVLAALGL